MRDEALGYFSSVLNREVTVVVPGAGRRWRRRDASVTPKKSLWRNCWSLRSAGSPHFAPSQFTVEQPRSLLLCVRIWHGWSPRSTD